LIPPTEEPVLHAQSYVVGALWIIGLKNFPGWVLDVEESIKLKKKNVYNHLMKKK
jgi:hypothetical protein